MGLDGGVGGLALLANLPETRTGLFRIRATTRVVLFFLAVFVVVAGSLLVHFRHFGLGDAGDAFVRVDEAGKQIRETSRRFLVLGGIVGVEDRLDGTRHIGQCRHDFTGAFFDALGDLDLAFTSQQLDGAHLAHVHAHRVRGATDIAFHRRQGCHRLFGCGFIG